MFLLLIRDYYLLSFLYTRMIYNFKRVLCQTHQLITCSDKNFKIILQILKTIILKRVIIKLSYFSLRKSYDQKRGELGIPSKLDKKFKYVFRILIASIYQMVNLEKKHG